jgi:hypothetical protein
MRAYLLCLLAPLTLTACITQGAADEDDAPDAGCLAVPDCPPGSAEVDECADATCTTETRCGQTIMCAPTDLCEAEPSCPEGTGEVNECPQDASCETYTVCGTTILCSDAACDPALLACPDGLNPVEACLTDECVTQADCGRVVRCDLVCDRIPPECAPGERPVQRCDEANPDCRRADNCGGSTWCVPEVLCGTAPDCPDGSWAISACPAGGECTEVIACGEVLVCTSDESIPVCGGLATCDEGMVQVAACPPEHPLCELVELCGNRAYCTPDMDCDAAPRCPEGFERVDQCAPDADHDCAWVVGCGEAFVCRG